jgi:hypothetical protein
MALLALALAACSRTAKTEITEDYVPDGRELKELIE